MIFKEEDLIIGFRYYSVTKEKEVDLELEDLYWLYEMPHLDELSERYVPVLIREDMFDTNYVTYCNGDFFINDSIISFKVEDFNWEEPSIDIFHKGNYLICVEYAHELQLILKALGYDYTKIFR